MNFIKTPHQKLLEEAGAVPATPGMIKTPQQALMDQSGVFPQFAQGGHISTNDMAAELFNAGQMPQYFSKGGQPEQMSPEFQDALDRMYHRQIFSGELPPEPTFQAQPVTATSRARDAFAKVIGDLPADRLFGTGSEGQKIEYLPLQFLNPVLATTETINAVPEVARQAHEGDTLGATLTAGMAGLGALPFIKPIKSAVKKIKFKK